MPETTEKTRRQWREEIATFKRIVKEHEETIHKQLVTIRDLESTIAEIRRIIIKGYVSRS